MIPVPLRSCTFVLFLHAVDDAQKHKHVAFIQMLHAVNGFLNQLRVLCAVIKKLLGCYFKIIADGKELFQRWKGVA